MYKLNFTKEELDSLVIQVGARIDHLKELQKKEAKNENVSRVIEIEKFLQPIVSAQEKMINELYR